MTNGSFQWVGGYPQFDNELECWPERSPASKPSTFMIPAQRPPPSPAMPIQIKTMNSESKPKDWTAPQDQRSKASPARRDWRLTTRTRVRYGIVLALAIGIHGGGAAWSQPILKEATTSIYAVVPDPVRISFAADGTMYVGRDASGSGGGSGDAVKIHRVAPGGSPVTEFGNLAISDPDAVVVDVAGIVSGTPGSVLVGGVHPGGTTGKIMKITPDGTVTTLFGPAEAILNPSHFIFDSAGRLLLAENSSGRVMVTTGGMPTNLFSQAGAAYVAEDATGRLVASSSSDGILRLFSQNGILLNASFATVRVSSPLARGPGGIWGTDLYAVAATGDLLRLNLEGSVTNRVGSGFANISDLQFGPDGALYASEFTGDRIYRFAQPTVPGTLTSTYARVTDPVRPSFAPDGTLFVGRDNTGSGGDFDDAVKIHRIGPGGDPVVEYGNTAITDPDAVFYDVTGQFSGTPGAVMVAGEQLNSAFGKIVKILPDGSITTIYGPTGFGFNPNLFVHDVANGRLLFSDDVGGKIWAMTNGTPAVLLSLANTVQFTVDELHRIVASTTGSPTLQLYSATGSLLTNTFARTAPDSPLALGPGGFWGTGVFCVNTNGDLLSLNTSGTASKWGTGFGVPMGMAFGPDKALYVCSFNNDLIWRITPDAPRLSIRLDNSTVTVSWPASADGWLLHATADLTERLAPWTEIRPPYQTNGENLTFTDSTPQGSKFYRLHKP